MTRKFWNWVRNKEPDSFGSDRTLYLDGEISDETWFGDEVTPKLFSDELHAGDENITLWINSPGGDVFAAAQIYNMLMDYLRVDSSDEDATVGILLASAIRLCIDIARLSDDQWEAIDSDATSSDEYTEAELSAIRETMKVAILYTCAYLFEHREEADHHALTMTLRSLLFAIREGAFS